MNDIPRELPSPAAPAPADPPPTGEALRLLAQGWRASGRLPAAVVDGVFERLQRRIAAGGAEPVDGFHWGAGWPSAAQALSAVAALADLEFEIIATLLTEHTLDAAMLRDVHAELGTARARVLERLPNGAQTLEQALQARDRQLSIATHELRTPISSILLNLQMLERASRERGPLDAETVQKLLAVPARQLRRLARMIGLLLDAAQVEAERLELDLEPLDLCDLVHDAAARLQELARTSGCTLVLDGCAPVPGHWDRLRMEQVITNLLTNAIKYGGGRVEAHTRPGGEAAIVVRDHGLGIAPEDQHRIFEPFERLASARSEEGAGLGLYIVREIVRAHGGRIEVHSAPGQGSTFTVLLPT